MTSGPDYQLGYYIETGSLVLVGLSSLVAVAVVVLVVRALAPRRGWTRDAAAALTWSSSIAVVAVLSLLWIAPWEPSPPPRLVMEMDGVELYAAPGVFTLVWLPPVMALLWSVLHVLRSGTGHHSPVLGIPVGLVIPALWLVAAPLQITVFTVGALGVPSWVGLVVWLVGQGLVATGRSWVGDVAVWTGIALVAADAWPGYVGLLSPVVVIALVLLQQRRREAVS